MVKGCLGEYRENQWTLVKDEGEEFAWRLGTPDFVAMPGTLTTSKPMVKKAVPTLLELRIE